MKIQWQYIELDKGTLGDSASVSPCYWIPYLKCFDVRFSREVSLIRTIINQSYWQFDWMLFYSRNINTHILAEAEPEMSQFLWFNLGQVVPQLAHVLNPIFGIIYVCCSYAVSLLKTTINYCYWQFDWVLFYSRNIHKIFWLRLNLAEAKPEMSHLTMTARFSLWWRKREVRQHILVHGEWIWKKDKVTLKLMGR